MDTKERFSTTTRILHWLVALAIITLLCIGFYMSTYEVGSLFSIHKSLGVLVLLIVLPRIFWRMKNGWPIPVQEFPGWERKLAHLSHWILILGSIIMPLSGFIFSGASGHGVSVFGLELVPTNYDANHHAVAFNKPVANLGHEIHEMVGTILAITIAIHVLAALKHHFINKDRTLLRMLGK